VGLILVTKSKITLAGKKWALWRQMALIGAVLLSGGLTANESRAENRTLKLYNTHTHENLSVTFKRNGRFIPAALRELNRFLRDWRRNEIVKIDPNLFDLVWSVYRKSGSRAPIHVVSGYRSPATNSMLRRRSRGVARNSNHTRGLAMDFHIPDVSMGKIRALALRREIGGVGYYPSARKPFVHLDTGNVRHWPRMSRAQLARVFPNGKTMHIPRDGKPMPRYKEALARHKGRKSGRTVVAAYRQPTPTRTVGTETNNSGRIIIARNNSSSSNNSLFSSFTGNNRVKPNQAAARSRSTAPKPPAAIAAQPKGSNPPGVKTTSGPENLLAKKSPVEATPPPLPRSRPKILVADRDDAPKPGVMTLASASAGTPVTLPPELGPTGTVTGPMPPMPTPKQMFASANPFALHNLPVPRPEPTLAYAPSAMEEILNSRNLKPSRSGSAFISRSTPSAPAGNGQQSEGRMTIQARLNQAWGEPIPQFAALPDRNEPRLLLSEATTRTMVFADFRHPNQRRMDGLFKVPRKAVMNEFAKVSSSDLRADRFSGPTVIALNTVSVY